MTPVQQGCPATASAPISSEWGERRALESGALRGLFLSGLFLVQLIFTTMTGVGIFNLIVKVLMVHLTRDACFLQSYEPLQKIAADDLGCGVYFFPDRGAPRDSGRDPDIHPPLFRQGCDPRPFPSPTPLPAAPGTGSAPLACCWRMCINHFKCVHLQFGVRP